METSEAARSHRPLLLAGHTTPPRAQERVPRCPDRCCGSPKPLDESARWGCSGPGPPPLGAAPADSLPAWALAGAALSLHMRSLPPPAAGSSSMSKWGPAPRPKNIVWPPAIRTPDPTRIGTQRDSVPVTSPKKPSETRGSSTGASEDVTGTQARASGEGPGGSAACAEGSAQVAHQPRLPDGTRGGDLTCLG